MEVLDLSKMYVEMKRVKGFRKPKIEVTAYFDTKGNQILEEPEEGQDIYTVTVGMHADSIDDVKDDLLQAIKLEVQKFKPLYTI